MLGLHIIAEFHGVDANLLNDEKFLEEAIIRACKRAGAKILGSVFHKFNPHGVTGVVAISESHVSIHTWPEFGYAAIDAFSCRSVNPRIIMEELIKILKPKKVVLKEVKRGEEYDDGITPELEPRELVVTL